jgi:hypothetical protein
MSPQYFSHCLAYVYVDPATFKVSGRTRYYWETTFYGGKNKKFSMKSAKYSLDCQTYDLTTLQIQKNDRRGKLKASGTGYDTTALAPQTIGRAMAEAVCALPARIADCDGVFRPCSDKDAIDALRDSD